MDSGVLDDGLQEKIRAELFDRLYGFVWDYWNSPEMDGWREEMPHVTREMTDLYIKTNFDNDLGLEDDDMMDDELFESLEESMYDCIY